MNKKNSISYKLFKSTLTVSALSIALSFVAFWMAYIAFVNVGYAFLASFGTGTVCVIFLSIILSEKTSRFVCKNINSISFENPYISEIYDEIEPLRQKIIAEKKTTSEHISLVEKMHEEQDKLRRDFTANVSHELKTPLTSIKGYSELIRDKVAKEEDIPRFAGKICDESQRLITLVGDIIKLSQLDGNDIEVKIEEIDLHSLCKAVIDNLERIADEKKVSILLVGDKPVIKGGEQIVEEMVFNLIDNAIKYNKEGGEVKVKLRQRIDGVELEVSDTGIGISEEDLPHIFERFWRADKSRKMGSTGLGLSIVKHGAMFMDARVSVESKVGVGTTVRIVF